MSRPSSDQGGEKFTIIVLRSSGGKDQFRVSPSDSIKSLKDAIFRSDALGRVRISDQRLFYLGRELVAARGKPLSSVGLDWDQASRFGGACVVHVHSRRHPDLLPPNTQKKRDVTINDIDEDEDVVCLDDPEPPASHARMTPAAQSLPRLQPPGATLSRNRVAAAAEAKEVIELLEDSSDDEEPVVAYASAAARRTKRQRS